MTRIYTRTGDHGDTGLFGGGRVGKDDPRVDAYGEVDELNATLGLARSLGLSQATDAYVKELQDQLFTVGALLATPPDSKATAHLPRLEAGWVARMEQTIDHADDSELEPLRTFILPGGTSGASALHLARTVCRRAERRVVTLVREGRVPNDVVVYLNRLSDLLFTLARVENRRAKVEDVPWVAAKP